MEKGRRPCFYEIFSPNSTSQRLRIPVGFVKHLAGRLSGTVYLFGPSGDVWPVGLARVNGDFVLGNGWSDFVRDHSLESGDLLVLRYDSDARFNVRVFDQSTCEKEAAFCSVRGQGLGAATDVGGKRERGKDGGSEVSPKRVRGSYSESEDKYWEDGIGVPDQGRGPQDGGVGNNTCLDVCLFRGAEESESPSRNSALISQLINWKDKAESVSSFRKGNGKGSDLDLNEKVCGSIFSEREKRVAQSFNSCFPYFVRIMKKFNVSGSYTLNIPYQFATEHLPNCKTEIVLRTIKGGCWTVNSVPTTRVHTSHTLCGGWMAFVRNNGIRIGDVCIFELIRKFELRVFILRVGKEGQDDQNVEVETMGNIGPTGARKPERLSKNSQNNSLKVHSRHIKKIELCDKNGYKKVQATSLTNHTRKSDDATNATSQKNGEMVSLQAQFGLRAMVARKEDEAAKNFVSGFPSFVRIMKKFNISGSYTLKIPYQFSTAYLPNCKTEITLRNMQGNSWIVNSVPDSKGRSVHTFCGGWMAFVRDNDIQIEDICMFELVSDHEMQVQISGAGRRAPDSQHEDTARSSTCDLTIIPLHNKLLQTLVR